MKIHSDKNLIQMFNLSKDHKKALQNVMKIGFTNQNHIKIIKTMFTCIP